MPEDKPQPQIFAILRNGHEVIRGGMLDLQKTVEAGDMERAQEQWKDLYRWTEMHKAMEEGNGSDETPRGFFKILDEKRDGIVTKNGLYDLHIELDKLEQRVEEACKESDMVTLQEIYPQFMKSNEAHLKQEEDVMMPSVMAMKKAGEPMKKIMVTEILPLAVAGDFEFFVKYANRVLERHHGGMPRVRVFDHALWAASTPEEWSQWNIWIRESLQDVSYNELQNVLPSTSPINIAAPVVLEDSTPLKDSKPEQDQMAPEEDDNEAPKSRVCCCFF